MEHSLLGSCNPEPHDALLEKGMKKTLQGSCPLSDSTVGNTKAVLASQETTVTLSLDTALHQGTFQRTCQVQPQVHTPYHTGCVCGLLGSTDEITLLVCSWLAVQNVLLDHLEIPVLAWNVPMLQGDEDRVCILPLKPLLCFQGSFRPRCVRVQVILEEVRLQKVFGQHLISEKGWGFPELFMFL